VSSRAPDLAFPEVYSISGIAIDPGGTLPSPIAIDQSGNIWAPNAVGGMSYSTTVTEISATRGDPGVYGVSSYLSGFKKTNVRNLCNIAGIRGNFPKLMKI
jgi:hypothetical protein